MLKDQSILLNLTDLQPSKWISQNEKDNVKAIKLNEGNLQNLNSLRILNLANFKSQTFLAQNLTYSFEKLEFLNLSNNKINDKFLENLIF